ncbi:MAG: alpha/beta hydrolase [Hydrocarboniphaga sp.]|uniref:flavin-containing monooxygenase n=1 Tax=Hydrocarboniphaga sp. TaxID=2033016 RepID=UPI0026158B59|nr:alpha/beta hydrolase fold domain-containing protein [Hydrocarboniphaga sp.]MDB5970838.1 alpha/beta hydrolase [Hydrocarboniphaga sp.]
MRSPDPQLLAQMSRPLAAVIIGSGFAGIGIAIALRRQGVLDFVIVEKAADVGGVWRDNCYPGAACDVPSHLYSFSFEPNPHWSHVFAPQAEIHQYLQHCVQKYDLLRHIRFSCEVEQAQFDEQQNLWNVSLAGGASLSATLLISATGQLSRPAYPRLPGIEDFAGRSFHSARWDRDYALQGKRVAVIGTGASAIQFVPAIAGQVQQLTLFQRSGAYLMARSDRAYSSWERALCRRFPWTMKLYRVGTYLRYETRALAFTRFKPLMHIAVGWPFKRLLATQVPDAALRERLMPDYPIGCKRVLLSDDYLAAVTRPNVELVTESIRRITSSGIETADGRHHEVDVLVYGTGFAATEFLTPMRIRGSGGLDLNQAWRRGAMAYLGMTVPHFPNFFMLYGPNTNLGHNSIVYMLESQIAHLMRCFKAMRASGMTRIEVESRRYRQYNLGIQQRLSGTVWNGCSSWYVDANGHNSTNWPGFTLSYRWLTRHTSLQAYRLTHHAVSPVAGSGTQWIAEPDGRVERAFAAFLRGVLRSCFRVLIGPPFGAVFQRRVVATLALLMPGRGGVLRYRSSARGVPVEINAPRAGEAGGAMLYLHGGAFCLGGPWTHRNISSHLAFEAGMSVWVPVYRLAPEHPYPAAINDAFDCYRAMLEHGYRAEQIVIAGDSAGGSLALVLALLLRERGYAMPAGLALISPVTDASLAGATIRDLAGTDPMLRKGWVEQGIAWYAAPSGAGSSVLEQDLRGLPPMIVQVGDQEILLSDSTRLAERAAACGVSCDLQIYMGRWHVFHLQALYLRSAGRALQALADFARMRVAGKRIGVAATARNETSRALES